MSDVDAMRVALKEDPLTWPPYARTRLDGEPHRVQPR
jgi:hypothetical protein